MSKPAEPARSEAQPSEVRMSKPAEPARSEAQPSEVGTGGGVSAPEDDEPEIPDPVVIPIEDSIDLHFFPPRDVGEIVDAYLEAAAERGFREVRIIHGRGRGVQRHRVQRHLARSPYVEAFRDAPADRGGWGATLVWLRPAGEGEEPGAER